jgi:hypothetical protein
MGSQTAIVKAYDPRPVQVNGVAYLVQELLVLEDGQEKRTTRSLGRAGDSVKSGGHIIPSSPPGTLRGHLGGQFVPSGDGFPDSPGDPDESPSEASSGGLSVGAVVHHRLNPELLGRIVELDTTSARIELLTWPTDWWRSWGQRPVPVLVENLELEE